MLQYSLIRSGQSFIRRRCSCLCGGGQLLLEVFVFLLGQVEWYWTCGSGYWCWYHNSGETDDGRDIVITITYVTNQRNYSKIILRITSFATVRLQTIGLSLVCGRSSKLSFNLCGDGEGDTCEYGSGSCEFVHLSWRLSSLFYNTLLLICLNSFENGWNLSYAS